MDLNEVYQERIKKRDIIKSGLNSLKSGNEEKTWLDDYYEWEKASEHQILLVIETKDPLGKSGSYGDYFIPESDNPFHMVDIEIKKMTFYVFERFLQYERSTVESIHLEKNPDNKVNNIIEYFETVDTYVRNLESLHTLLEMERLSMMKATVVFANGKAAELIPRAILFDQMLRKCSVEAIYLLYTIWRITKERRYYKKLIIAIELYIKENFHSYDKDPELKLSISLKNVHFTERLRYIAHWLTRIAAVSIDRFELYDSKGWFTKYDYLTDNSIVIPDISPYGMYMYAQVLKDDESGTVIQKAIAFHAHDLCVKSLDVFTVFRDIFRILLENSDEEIIKQKTTRDELLNIYDKLGLARHDLMEALFKNVYFYDQEKKRFDVARLEEQEKAAIEFSGSVEDLLKLTQSILDEDIDGLISSKNKYMNSIACYLSRDKIAAIDEFMSRVVEKLKERVQEEEGYEEVYDSVMTEMDEYAALLFRQPQIYNTLASAEYLYKKYIIKEKRENFDYSCIAILYFLILEDVLNKYIYAPYRKEKLAGHEEDKNLSQYLVKPENYRYRKNNETKFKNACELGPLGYLLKNIEKEPFFKEYLSQKYSIVKSQLINKLGTRIVEIVPKRNAAAHGDKIVTGNDVTSDKMLIYDNSKDGQLRGLVIEILDQLNTKKARP